MHAERFVNLAPLSLLANTMGLWFKDVRTHPPIVFRFPPLREPPTDSPDGRPQFHSGEGTDSILSLRDLLLGRSPYATLDDARLTAFPPAWKASGNFGSTSDVSTQTLVDEGEPPASPSPVQTWSTDTATASSQTLSSSPIPNPTLEIDLRTLNLHLTLRVKEILACAEAMWDWVVDFQAKMKGFERKSTEEYAVIGKLTRAEFDDMLVRFDLDMRQHMALGSALQDRFDWTINPGPTPQGKRFFDASCAKWDAYIRNTNASRQQRPTTPTHLQTQTPSPDSPSPPHAAHVNCPERGTSSISATRLSRSLRVFVAWKP
ncbi:hypothetical protein BS17DRAFT_710961 [Gyrodon lividus]|nr:hypothetical protein BS17DRAFT_710961 [Gyrodon lividus]